MDFELTRRARLSSMLIAAAVVVPVLALAAILTLQHFTLVHYDTHTLTLWLVLDAVILAAGLIVRESASVSRAAKRRARRLR
jgi:uncharacterized membrane protein